MRIINTPSWNMQGVLPPVDSNAPTSSTRSPYKVGLMDLIRQFGFSRERREILRGFLQYRSMLHQLKIVHGFQWLNGSFLENVEKFNNRPPNDLDIVTFFFLPEGQTQESLYQSNPNLFDPKYLRDQYKVDGYFVTLTSDEPYRLISNSIYWYSVWSHRRNGMWKGYLEIDLSPDQDNQASSQIQQIWSKESA